MPKLPYVAGNIYVDMFSELCNPLQAILTNFHRIFSRKGSKNGKFIVIILVPEYRCLFVMAHAKKQGI